VFPSGFPATILISYVHAECSIHFMVLDLINLLVFGEEYRLWSSSLCIVLRSVVTPSVLGTNIHLRNLFSNALNLCSPLGWEKVLKINMYANRLYAFPVFLLNFNKYYPKFRKICKIFCSCFAPIVTGNLIPAVKFVRRGNSQCRRM
jgi:hypothetical protein